MEKQKFRPKHVHDGKQHPKTKTSRQRTLVYTHSSSRHLKRLSPHLSTWQARPQWIQKNICIFEKQIPLEGHEEISVSTLHKLPSLRKTQHQNSAAEKRTLLITTPTNGIHSNGPNRRIPPSVQQRQQIRLDRSVHAHRIHILHSTKKQTCRRRDKSLHRPHILYFWTIKKDPHRQRHQVQKQTLDWSFWKIENRQKNSHPSIPHSAMAESKDSKSSSKPW